MNRSKIIASTALASVMAATAANAEMSISGLYAGKLTDADGGGLASGSLLTLYTFHTATQWITVWEYL